MSVLPENKSIAVLPFVNMSADSENEYFSDGITEEIINALTTVEELKVIARTSSFAFKNKNIDIRTIGQQLGVSTILEGSIRKANNWVRITAQLIDTTDGAHIWSQNFDREMDNIFALQDEISLLIADQIRENFGHFNIRTITKEAPTKNTAAYEALLQGSYYLKRKDFEDIKKALDYFQQAVALDPHYAQAYAYIGETYLHQAGFGILSNTEAHGKARIAAKKALSINEQEPLAHKVLAYIHFFFDWDWDAALFQYNKAIENGLPNQNEFISYYYVFIQKDYDRAIHVAQQLLDTDPLHVIGHWQLGLCFFFAQRFEEALQAFDNALKIDVDFGEAQRWRGLVLGYLGKFDDAQLSIQKALDISAGEGLAKLDLLMVKILMGQKKEALAEIKQTDYIDPMDPAMLYTMLKMPDEAIAWLERGYQERSVMLVTLKHHWIWDNIRSDERFQVIYDRMNFADQSNYRPSPIKTIVIPEKPATSTALMTPEEIEQYLVPLHQSMANEQLFLDASLSLRQLAEHIDLHPNKLSWLLNDQVGKNFNEFINAFRVKVFKTKALDPANSHLTLLGLAYESGFNSKTVFNAFFKKTEGMTPRKWVKSQQ